MSAKTINIKFTGYWRDENKPGVPAQSGVYCVYECRYNDYNDTVSLLKLIYIGEADDVQERIANHEKYQDWLKHVRFGNELFFSLGPVLSTDRERAEAAMIFKHKPPENEEYKYSFPFDQTTISLSDDITLLKTHFTVERTE